MELSEIFFTLASVLLVLYVLWFLFLADANFLVALAEKFGRPISAYQGKVIWVTGASAGLGEAMAYELASVGAKIVLTARTKVLLEKVKDKCLEISQGKLTSEDILVLPLDITNYDAHKASVNDVLNHFGQIDVLMNNAAKYHVGPVLQTDQEVVKEIFDINFFATVNLTKLVLKHFLDRGKGQFVVVSSVAGKCGIPSISPYAATKHALHGYFEALRMEHFRNNIHVSVVCPGIFRSSMYQNTVFTSKNTEESKGPHYGCSQMPSSRCARLTLVASVNMFWEAWIGYQPFLCMMWAAQYIPDISRRIMLSLVYNRRRVQELNDGIWPDDLPAWEPLLR